MNLWGLGGDALGNLFVSQYTGGVKVRKVDLRSGLVHSIGGAVTNVIPLWVRVDGDVVVGETALGTVQYIYGSANKTNVKIAGGAPGYSGDFGAATSAGMSSVMGLWGAPNGEIFVAHGSVVRKLTPPTVVPTHSPTISFAPTYSQRPSVVPSAVPSVVPSAVPSAVPSIVPSAVPTVVPSAVPSMVPTTAVPSVTPSATPSRVPSVVPSATPSVVPSAVPSRTPSAVPSASPLTATPSRTPTLSPAAVPNSFVVTQFAGKLSFCAKQSHF